MQEEREEGEGGRGESGQKKRERERENLNIPQEPLRWFAPSNADLADSCKSVCVCVCVSVSLSLPLPLSLSLSLSLFPSRRFCTTMSVAALFEILPHVAQHLLEIVSQRGYRIYSSLLSHGIA